MRIFVAATSVVPPNAEREIKQGKRGRIDYLELCARLGAPYIDYGLIGSGQGRLRRIEEKLRLDIFQALQVARQVRKQKCDVVLSLSERIAMPLAYLLGRSVRHVVVLHHMLSPQKLRMVKKLQTARRWDLLIAQTRAEAEAVRQELQLAPERVRVLHAPIDTEFYKPPAHVDMSDEQDHILSLGLAQRDYPTLIQAMHRLPHVACYISATSAWVSHRAGYEDEVMPSNVHIKSYDHPSIIVERYAKSRFTVIPMRKQTTHWCAGSTSVLQPQAVGRPVVVAGKPGLVDYVLHGETGMAVDPGDPAALAAAIDEVWRDNERSAAMGRRGREWVVANFSMERWLDTLTDILHAPSPATRNSSSEWAGQRKT